MYCNLICTKVRRNLTHKFWAWKILKNLASKKCRNGWIRKKIKHPYEKSQDPEYVIKMSYSGIRHSYTYMRVQWTYITHFGVPLGKQSALKCAENTFMHQCNWFIGRLISFLAVPISLELVHYSWFYAILCFWNYVFFVFAFKSIKATKVVIYHLNVHIIAIPTIL